MNSIEEILSLITKTQISIVKKALRYYSTLMPGFTHLQMAQPITFGHHLMAWFEMLNRDFSRFQESKKRMNSLPFLDKSQAKLLSLKDKKALFQKVSSANR